MKPEEEIEHLRRRVAELEGELEVKKQHLDLATDGYFDWDLMNPEYEYLSPSFWTTFGYDPADMEHSPTAWQNIIHPDDEKVAVAAFENHVASGSDYQVPVRYRHAQGHWEWVICRGQVLRGEDGTPLRMLGTHQSITELKRAETALEQFAFHAAHDMKEPLRKISAFGERLQKYADNLPDRGQVYLDRMLDASRRMSKLIDDLLKYARISRVEKDTEAVDLREVITEVVDDYSAQLNECGAEVTVEELEMVEADWTQMRQLFQNLVSNAIKFRREGVPLEITVAGKPVANDMYEVSFSDNGIGFDEQYKEKIFQVFQRLHGRDEYEGTGIGLAVCARIVQSHGGAMDASSVPGAGATFAMMLPLEKKLNQTLDLPSEAV